MIFMGGICPYIMAVRLKSIVLFETNRDRTFLVMADDGAVTKRLISNRSRGLDCVAGLRMFEECPDFFRASLQRPQ